MSEWQRIGTFAPSSWRRVSGKKSPIDILLAKLVELEPAAESVEQFGYSEELNRLLKKELKNWAKKYKNWNGETADRAIAWTMLSHSPCTVKGIKGMQILFRGDNK
jgi:hypothetical protein